MDKIPQCDSIEKCWRLGQISVYHAMAHWMGAEGFYPHPSQCKIIDGLKKNTTIVAGRRFGKSVLFAALALHYAMTHKNSSQFIIAPSQDQARIIQGECTRLTLQSKMLSNMVESIKSFPFPMIHFKSGSEIHARSIGNNEGKYLRGHKADVVYLDEAAYMDENVINTVIMPLLADTDGELRCISTPLGQRGFFYESFMRGKKDDPSYASFQFNSYKNPHISHEFIDRQKAIVTDVQWRCEWGAEFLDDSVCVFRGDSIIAATADFDEEFKYDEKRNYWMGVDVAKTYDYTAITVIDGTDQKNCKVVYTERFNNRPYSYVVERVLALASCFSVMKIHIDETGVGAGVTEQIMAHTPIAEGFTFSQASKVALINTLKTGLEQHRLKISSHNEVLLNELRYYQYDVSDLGSIRMSAPSGQHDDMLISLALAYQKLAVQYADAETICIQQVQSERKPLNVDESSIIFINGSVPTPSDDKLLVI